jgi:hypothetical protein
MGKFLFWVVAACILIYVIGGLYHQFDEPAERQEFKEFVGNLGEDLKAIKDEVENEFYDR